VLIRLGGPGVDGRGGAVKRAAMRLAVIALLFATGSSGCRAEDQGTDAGVATSVPMTSHGYEVHRFVVGAGDEENTYLLVDSRSKKGLVIDPGGRTEALEAQVRAEGVHVVAILNTHGHYDHIGANAYYRDLYGVDVYADAYDVPLYRSQVGVDPENAPTKELPTQGDLEIGGLRVRVIPTPGHTPGSVCFLAEDVLFSGDTLFEGAVGRTDDNAAARTLVESIRDRLLILPPGTLVYSGHGDATTIGREQQSNPYL
jgi:hydroxyacylglutathione hydrolase